MKLACLLLLAALSGCRSAPPCAFTIGNSHMTNRIATPFVVAELRGRFLPEGIGSLIRFQVSGPAGRIDVPVADDGTFALPGLRAGRYCFHTSSDTMQGYDGVIVIDPGAPAQPIEITVAYGV
jgi:hypothetical protein